jgi:hypothetical protein
VPAGLDGLAELPPIAVSLPAVAVAFADTGCSWASLARSWRKTIGRRRTRRRPA